MHKGDYVHAINRHVRNKKGVVTVWEIFRRQKIFGRSVMIAAVTPEKEIILEKGFRAAPMSYILELPAGLRDKEEETEEQTVRRELLEETGYAVEEVKLLFSGLSSPGFEEDDVAMFWGKNARKVQEPELEDSEEIEVIKVPVSGLKNYLLEQLQRGAKVDIKLFSVIPFLQEFYA